MVTLQLFSSIIVATSDALQIFLQRLDFMQTLVDFFAQVSYRRLQLFLLFLQLLKAQEIIKFTTSELGL